MAARRSAILDAAREMLGHKGVTEISLREIADRVGLAKSNVLRYFGTREVIFLEVLDGEYKRWLAEVEHLLGRPRALKASYANEIRVATIIADSLAGQRLLCELLAAMAGVLERNIAGDFAREFKQRTTGDIMALADLMGRQLPWLTPEQAGLFAEGALTLTAGMYPFSVPTAAVGAVIVELGMPDPQQRFRDGLREGLITWLIGAAARSAS